MDGQDRLCLYKVGKHIDVMNALFKSEKSNCHFISPLKWYLPLFSNMLPWRFGCENKSQHENNDSKQ